MRVLVFMLVGGTVAVASPPTPLLGTASAGLIPAVVLNEIHADPDASAGDANGDGAVQSTADEFLEVFNPGSAVLDVSGWTVEDAISTRHVFPSGSIVPAGCGIVVFGGGTPTGSFGSMLVQTASSGALGLNNSGDTVVVRDGGALVTSYAYGSEGGNNQSLTRSPDIVGVDPLVRHMSAAGSGGVRFSPGTRIDGSAFSGCAVPGPTATMPATPTSVPSSTPIPTATAVVSATPTAAVTATPVLTATPIATVTAMATASPSTTPTPLPTMAATATGTATPTAHVTPTETTTVTPMPSATSTVTAVATATPVPSATVTATVTAVATVAPTPIPTVVPALCLAAPRVGCATGTRPGRGVLVVRDHQVDRRDRVVWKWRKGAETTIADFGDPRGTDDYALCLYDESGPTPLLVLAAAIPANDECSRSDGDCWVQARAGARVLRYKTATGYPDGIVRVVLKPGAAGRARITVVARGELLGVPALPLGLPVRVQFQATQGPCWESRFSAAGARRNDGPLFRGRPD